jgi:phage-related protein
LFRSYRNAIAQTYEYSYNWSHVKSARFVGTAREDLAGFPESVRRRIGHELFMVQVGREPSDFKPIPSVGPGAYEIRVRDGFGAFRVIYVAKFKQAIYVLHAFRKKTQEMTRVDIDLAARRYRLIWEEL